jgi:sterol desaturase/sphingolipid hydroxylase (fatty acid hydroxylase superfamily)
LQYSDSPDRTRFPRMRLTVTMAAAVTAVLWCLHAAWFSQATWRWLASVWFKSERLKFALVGSLWLETVFWLAQALFWLITRDSQLDDRWSIKPSTGRSRLRPPAQLVSKCLADLVMGHALRPVLLWLAFPLYEWRSGAAFGFTATGSLPSPTEMLAHVLFAIVVDDTLFYWAHRLLHHPRLYKYVHKQHHEFVQPIGLATEYAHLVEDLFCNTLATVAGPLLLRSHAVVVVGYAGIKLWQSIDAHSGVLLPAPLSMFNILPGMDCSCAHDFHHSHNVGNFGGFFMHWDWLCGTDAAYRRYLERKQAQHE